MSGISTSGAPFTGFGKVGDAQHRRQEVLWGEVSPGFRRGVLDSEVSGDTAIVPKDLASPFTCWL